MLDRFRSGDPYRELAPVAKAGEIIALQEAVPRVHVARPVQQYIVDLARATRTAEGIELGVSPRGTLALLRAAQALAAVRGRDYVLPDDVQHLARPVLAHRLVASTQLRLRGRGAAEALDQILASTPVPAEPVPKGAV